MRLTDLARELAARLGRVDVAGGVAGQDENVEVTGVTLDSRRAGPGVVFCALKGERFDGNSFIEDAARRGAAAVISDRRTPLAVRLPQLVVPDARAAMRTAAWAIWGDSARRVRLVGVTGTNGKTTVAHLTAAMLRAAGLRTGLIGTLGRDVGSGLEPTGYTTPETAEILESLDVMNRAGARWAVLEVSSHALALGRVGGLDFSVGVFTNLTQDHLDFHGSLESYRDAKAVLFERLAGDAAAVLNRRDATSREYAGRTRARVVWSGLTRGCDVSAEPLACGSQGGSAAPTPPRQHGRRDMPVPGSDIGEAAVSLSRYIRGGSGPHTRRVVLRVAGEVARVSWRPAGRHNLENLASAAAAASAAGVELCDIARAASEFPGVPGRLEAVEAGQDFRVLVDYAHTPDGLEEVLASLGPETRGRLVCVFGCGGDRDRKKRPLMGRVVERLADRVIVTSDNPRTESPAEIIREILAGLEHPSRAVVEPDREKAIEAGIAAAREGDVVLVAGKGHETEQIVGHERRPFDDRKVARAALVRLRRLACSA